MDVSAPAVERARQLARAQGPRNVTFERADAGAGNIMAADGRWMWHDFEDTCTGPIEWDLAAATHQK